MKREKFLEILSWEHHDGLVIALRLEKGLDNGTELSTLQTYLNDQWKNALKDHFYNEEQYLIQPVQYYEMESAPIAEMLRQHKMMADLIASMEQKPDAEKIRKFIAALRVHIQFEEKELYPYIEKLLSPELKDKVYRCLTLYYKKGDKGWDPEFWKTN